MKRDMPRNYLPDDERQQVLRDGGMNAVYMAESAEARRVGEEDAAWAWLAMAELPAETLLEEAKAMMAMILSKSPIAIGYCKAAINRGADTDLRNGLEIEKECWAVVFGTKDKEEGISAFLEKRTPQFPNQY